MGSRYTSIACVARHGLALLSCSIGVASTVLAQTSVDIDSTNPDVAAILQLHRDFENAFDTGDAKIQAELFTSDLVYMEDHAAETFGSAIVIRKREAFLKQYRVRLTVTVQEVKVVGALAYDRATFEMIRTPKAGGQPVTLTGRFLEILTKDGGRWRSHRVMTNDPYPEG